MNDRVQRLREQSQAPALAWLTEAADEIERLRAVLDAIDALHYVTENVYSPQCSQCWKLWPCRSHLLIHPEEARRG